MKLFTLGPVEMYNRTRDTASRQVPYFRVPEFSEVVLETQKMLCEVLCAPKESETIFLTNSGTGAMEATVINCFTQRDKLLIINGGLFGRVFMKICDIHSIPYESIDLSIDEALTQQHLQKYNGAGITGLLVNLHETSTGQLYDINMLAEFCKRNQAYFIVDAISSFLADPFDMQRYGVDAVMISSQKGAALEPGLSAVVLSRRIFEERVMKNDPRSYYFDFKDYAKNMERGQTPFTPAIGIIFQLNDMLKYVLEIGLDNKIAHTAALGKDFRERAKMIGLSIPAYPLSNAMTPLVFQDIDAFYIHEALKNEYDIFLNPSGLSRETIVRVGHLGNLSIKDNRVLIAALKELLEAGRKK